MQRIAAVVLAAGRSVRFEGTKLLAQVGSVPLLRIVVEDVVRAVDCVVVVLGHNAEQVRTALSGLPVQSVVNPRYAEGMGTSVAAGVSALPKKTNAVLIALGDQPVRAQVIAELIACYGRGQHAIVAPTYNGVRGNPVLFDRKLFHELESLTGDRGARDLIERHHRLLTVVPFGFPAPLDVDTQDDFQKLLRQL
jgi:molybdenum cofactor cytidylyltransferase